MRSIAVALILLAGCKGQQGTPRLATTTAPVSEADAKAFADALLPALRPCDEARVADLVDADAMAAKFANQSTLPEATTTAAKLATTTIGARILCTWMRGVDEVKLLRIKMVGGEPHPILRRTIHDPRSAAVVVAYDELQLGTSRKDHHVRIVDAFTYVQGRWITQILSGNVDGQATIDYLGDLPQSAPEVRKAYELQHAGDSAGALAVIDALPKKAHDDYPVQLVRVRASAVAGKDAYKQALDELAALFPGDPSIGMIEGDGRFSIGDYDGALTWIGIVDTALGGDAFQESHRAMAYLQRSKPGDLDLAAQSIDKAIAMEPTLARAWEVKLDVTLAQKNWAAAVAVMQELETKHGVHFDDGKLAAQPAVAELIASPEYKEWRAQKK